MPPDAGHVLHGTPRTLSLLASARYILAIRTNVVLILASGLGYFYFTAIETFGLVYFQDRYQLSHGEATVLLAPLAIGGLIGAIVGGRLADRVLRHGRIDSRITVAAWSPLLATALFVPGLLASSAVIGLPLVTLAATAFSGGNPPPLRGSTSCITACGAAPNRYARCCGAR